MKVSDLMELLEQKDPNMQIEVCAYVCPESAYGGAIYRCYEVDGKLILSTEEW